MAASSNPQNDFPLEASIPEGAVPLESGGKGLGELTSVSVAPAIANAVYHATGKPVRDLPSPLRSCCDAGGSNPELVHAALPPYLRAQGR